MSFNELTLVYIPQNLGPRGRDEQTSRKRTENSVK